MPRAEVKPRICKIMHGVDEDKAHPLALKLKQSFARSDTQVLDIWDALHAGFKRNQVFLRAAVARKGIYRINLSLGGVGESQCAHTAITADLDDRMIECLGFRDGQVEELCLLCRHGRFSQRRASILKNVNRDRELARKELTNRSVCKLPVKISQSTNDSP